MYAVDYYKKLTIITKENKNTKDNKDNKDDKAINNNINKDKCMSHVIDNESYVLWSHYYQNCHDVVI